MKRLRQGKTEQHGWWKHVSAYLTRAPRVGSSGSVNQCSLYLRRQLLQNWVCEENTGFAIFQEIQRHIYKLLSQRLCRQKAMASLLHIIKFIHFQQVSLNCCGIYAAEKELWGGSLLRRTPQGWQHIVCVIHSDVSQCELEEAEDSQSSSNSRKINASVVIFVTNRLWRCPGDKHPLWNCVHQRREAKKDKTLCRMCTKHQLNWIMSLECVTEALKWPNFARSDAQKPVSADRPVG